MHPVGRFKSVFFHSLGFSTNNWEILRGALLERSRSADAVPGQPSPYGAKVRDPCYIAMVSRSVCIGRDGLDRVRGSNFRSLCHCVSGIGKMFKLLDTVVLERDLAEHSLRRGDLGAVVDVHPPDGLEVEFVVASGRTQALVTLREADVRSVGDADLVAVRELKRTA